MSFDSCARSEPTRTGVHLWTLVTGGLAFLGWLASLLVTVGALAWTVGEAAMDMLVGGATTMTLFAALGAQRWQLDRAHAIQHGLLLAEIERLNTTVAELTARVDGWDSTNGWDSKKAAYYDGFQNGYRAGHNAVTGDGEVVPIQRHRD
jgi:hypothetical protein